MKLEKMTSKRKEKGEHTCPEVLIKMSEQIKGLLTNTNYNLTILSVFTVLKYGHIVIGICWPIHSAWLMLQDRCENFGENTQTPHITESRAATFRS